MKQPQTQRARGVEQPGEPAGAWAAWDRFWFKPADPTGLGLIRLCAGLVVLYVHLAYSFGLLDYVGPEAWLDTQAAHYLRAEIEIQAPGVNWTDRPETITKGHYLWSIYFHLTEPAWIYLAHAGILL